MSEASETYSFTQNEKDECRAFARKMKEDLAEIKARIKSYNEAAHKLYVQRELAKARLEDEFTEAGAEWQDSADGQAVEKWIETLHSIDRYGLTELDLEIDTAEEVEALASYPFEPGKA